MYTDIYKLTFTQTGYECFFAFLYADSEKATDEYIQKETQAFLDILKEASGIYTIEKVIEKEYPSPAWLRTDITRYLVCKQQIKVGRTYPVNIMIYMNGEYHSQGIYATDIFKIVNGVPQDSNTDEKNNLKIINKYINFSI